MPLTSMKRESIEHGRKVQGLVCNELTMYACGSEDVNPPNKMTCPSVLAVSYIMREYWPSYKPPKCWYAMLGPLNLFLISLEVTCSVDHVHAFVGLLQIQLCTKMKTEKENDYWKIRKNSKSEITMRINVEIIAKLSLG